MPLGMELGLSPGDFVLGGDPVRRLNFRPMFIIGIVSCRTRVKRLYACAQIHYLCFSSYRIWVKYSGESRDITGKDTGVICAKNRLQHVQSYRYRNIFYKHRRLSQKRLKPSPVNSNVHRRRNLDRTVCFGDRF